MPKHIKKSNKKDKPKAKPKKKQTLKFITPVGFTKTKRVKF